MFNEFHDGWMWGMHGGWWVFWILIVLAFVLLLNRTGTNAPSTPHAEPKESPMDVLKRRYAEGELSTEEYEERKERLERDR